MDLRKGISRKIRSALRGRILNDDRQVNRGSNSSNVIADCGFAGRHEIGRHHHDGVRAGFFGPGRLPDCDLQRVMDHGDDHGNASGDLLNQQHRETSALIVGKLVGFTR